MTYIENNLVKGEQIIFLTKLHWWAVIGPAVNAFIIILALGLLGLLYAGTSTTSDISAAVSGFVLLALVFVAVSLVSGYVNYKTSEFGVTNRRVMIKTGLIRRRTLELNLGKIESFQVHESLMGRLLGYKNLKITGSGGTKQEFNYVDNADAFRRRVVELSSNIQQ